MNFIKISVFINDFMNVYRNSVFEHEQQIMVFLKNSILKIVVLKFSQVFNFEKYSRCFRIDFDYKL